MIDIDVSKIISEIGEPKARLIENEDEKRQKMYLWISSFVFLFILLIGIAVFFFLSQSERAKAADVNKNIATLRKDNSDMESTELEAKFIQERNKNILSIIQQNPNWSYVFEKLEEVVPKGITFTRFEVESPVAMKIAGISPDYETLSKLAVSMSNFTVKEGDVEGEKDIKVFGNVSVTNASLTKSQDGKIKVDFAVSFDFIKKINKESINPITEGNTVVPTPVIPEPASIPVPVPIPTPATPPASEGGGLPVL